MSNEACGRVLMKSKHKGHALLALLVLADSAGGETGFEVQVDKALYAKLTRMSEPQFERVLRQLRRSGELVPLSGRNWPQPNWYRITTPEV